MSDYLDKIQTQKKDGTPLATVPFRDSAAREDITTIQNELTTDTTTIEGNPLNFTTLSAQKSKSTIIDIEPIQDLHGYDKPWVGGAGKNLLNPDFRVNEFKNVRYYYSSQNGLSLKAGNYWVRVYSETTPGTINILNKSTSEVIKTSYNKVCTFTLSENTDIYLDIYYTSIPSEELSGVIVMLGEGTSTTDYEPYENICPISGRSEIGILGWGNIFSNTLYKDGYGINSSGSEYVSSSYYIAEEDLLPNTTYTLSCGFSGTGTSQSTRVQSFDSSNNALQLDSIFLDPNNRVALTFTTPANTAYVHISVNKNATDIQMDFGNHANTYTPYTKSTDLTINLGQTVYGGTLDVENGKCIVTHRIVDLGNLDYSQGSSASNHIWRTSDLASSIKIQVSGKPLAIASCYEGESWSGISANSHGKFSVDNRESSSYIGRLSIVDHNYDSYSDFTASISGQTLCYDLATPITLQLTSNEISLLEGVNNISTTGDKLTLTYRNGSVATLADLLDLEKKLTDEEPYGFIEHMNILDPAQRIEYIGKNKNYSPMTINLAGDHLANYNEWYDFPVIKENKPYMIKADGTIDYALDPNDYTKKFDGSDSDVANTSYTGGAFAWIPKTYKREFTVGDDRYVYISTKKLSDEYEAIGFIDENGLEHDGAWIPMFYGTEITQDGTVKIMTLATGAPTQNRNTDTQKTYLTNANPDTLFFGGAIVKVLTDIMIMLGKNSDVQAVFGTGNMSGGNGAQYMKNNACIDGGAFYGTTTNNVLNKAFHSLVLLTQNQWQRDPYTLNIQGEYIVSPYYKYDLTGDSYVKTGVFVTPPSSNNWVYPHKSVSVPHWGAEPVGPYSGSTTTGWADGQYTLANQLTDTTVRVVQRFGGCNNGRAGGVRCVHLAHAASYTHWSIGASPLLLSKEKTPV